jgi:hypothetical protein
MDEWTRRSLTIHKSTAPKIYLLLKIHKFEFDASGNRIMKFRPIVSCINSPSYNVGKFIGHIIHKSIDHDLYNIRNSYEFQKFIVQQNITENHLLLSLDVVNLFGCIPRSLVYECIIYEWDSIKVHTKLNLKMFLKFVRFIFRSSYFMFNGKFHGQWEGSGMGLPPSPNFADLVMTCLLNRVKRDLNFDMLFLKKYVDDLVLSIPEDKVSELLEKFNSYNQNIKFTIELEKDRKLPFLDLMLSIGHDGKITTSWYMKPIASGRCLNFLSCHPRSQKINTAEGVIFRILSLSTNLESPEVKNQIRTVLRNNNYPTKLINILYNRVILKIKKSNSSDTSINPSKDSENNKKHMSIHYVPGLSEKLARNLESDWRFEYCI